MKKTILYFLRNGTTLLETIIAVAVLGLFSGIAITLYLTVMQSYYKSSIITKLRSEGDRVMEEMCRVVRSGTDIIGTGTCSGSPEECDALEILLDKGSLEYSQNGSCLTEVFEFLPSDGINNARINKDISGGENCITPEGQGVITDADRTVGVHVSDLEFIVTDGADAFPDRVEIVMTLEQGLDVPDRQEYKASITLRESVSTRKY